MPKGRKTETCVTCLADCYPNKSQKCRKCFLSSKRPPEWGQAISEGKLGHKHTEETKRKIGEASANRSPEVINKIRTALLNRTVPDSVKIKISQNNARYWKGKPREEMRGAGNHNWLGGKTAESDKIRKSLEYKKWRETVFSRDKYTCVWCGDNKGGNLQADHIKPFAHFPELRFCTENGRTLCKECHKKTDTYLNKTRYRHYEN